MKVITSCKNCLGRSSCPVWGQLNADQSIAYYHSGIIHPDCPLENLNTPKSELKSWQEFPMASPDKIFERLVALYNDNYLCVAKICDEVLDRSGALLGEVRNRAREC